MTYDTTYGWLLVVFGFKATLTAKVISWRLVTHMCFLAFSPVLTQLFFPKPPTIFLTCFCRGERRKYTGKKVHLNQGLNSQPSGHESNMLTTEPPGRGTPYGPQNVSMSERQIDQHIQREITSLNALE